MLAGYSLDTKGTREVLAGYWQNAKVFKGNPVVLLLYLRWTQGVCAGLQLILGVLAGNSRGYSRGTNGVLGCILRDTSGAQETILQVRNGYSTEHSGYLRSTCGVPTGTSRVLAKHWPCSRSNLGALWSTLGVP